MAQLALHSSGAATGSSRDHFARYFGDRRRVFIPAIHVHDRNQAWRDADTVHHRGADGVFLVNHGIGYQKLLRIARIVAGRHPGWFVGVKCLDLRPQDVFCRLPPEVGGVWTDIPTGTSNRKEARAYQTAIKQARRDSNWNGLHFVTVNPFLQDESPIGPAIADFADVIVTADAAGQSQDNLLQQVRSILPGCPVATLTRRPEEDPPRIAPASCQHRNAEAKNCRSQ